MNLCWSSIPSLNLGWCILPWILTDLQSFPWILADWFTYIIFPSSTVCTAWLEIYCLPCVASRILTRILVVLSFFFMLFSIVSSWFLGCFLLIPTSCHYSEYNKLTICSIQISRLKRYILSQSLIHRILRVNLFYYISFKYFKLLIGTIFNTF